LIPIVKDARQCYSNPSTGNQCSFLIPKEVGGRCPFPPDIWATPFEKRRLRLISAFNLSTVRASEKCSIIANRKSTTHALSNELQMKCIRYPRGGSEGGRGPRPPCDREATAPCEVCPMCPPIKFVTQAVLTQLGANSPMLDLRLSDNFHRLMLLMSVLSSEELMCTYVMFCGHFCVHAIIVVFV